MTTEANSRDMRLQLPVRKRKWIKSFIEQYWQI